VDAEAQVQIETLGANLNAALARVASEERARAEAEAAKAEAESARADLEARERARLEEEAKDLGRYRSEFFGRMRDILGAREGVEVVGDRFVFSSEVLFPPGSATLGAEGRAQVARVAAVIREIADDIPPEIDWVLRVDGHTDRIPLGFGSAFRDNWELSQARALSVVRYMIDAEGLPADRLAATGFGEFQPIDTGDSPEALARNRRIELKFTER
jgi:chemotaxis protein MotB